MPVYHPVEGYPSVAQYLRTCILELKPRDEVLITLISNGFTKRQAIVLYRNNVRRFFEARIEWLSKNDESES
jgi:hypothetical protein